MFAFLRGEVAMVESDRVVLDVQGVGYELQASARTLGQLKTGDDVCLQAYMHLSQDAVALYGFWDQQEKQMFKRLISVSRIGPKVALAALSTADAASLATAIATGDDQMIARVPGLGKKTAQRLILELKEKIANEDMIQATGGRAYADVSLVGNSMQNEAMTALMALGYDRNTAMQAVSMAPNECERVEELITLALKNLAH